MLGSKRFRCNIVSKEISENSLDDPITKSFSVAWIFSNISRMFKSTLQAFSYRNSQILLGSYTKKDGRPDGQGVLCFLILWLFHVSITLLRSYWMTGMKQNLRHSIWIASDKSRTPLSLRSFKSGKHELMYLKLCAWWVFIRRMGFGSRDQVI